MTHFLYMATSRDPQFHVTHHSGVTLVTHYNSDGVDQIVVPKSGGFGELFNKGLHAKQTPLASHLGVQKVTYVFFKKIW